MTEPIAPSRSYVETIYDAADRSGVRTKEIQARMTDPSLVQTEAAQRYTPGDGMRDLTEHGVKHLLAKVVPYGLVLEAAGPLTMLKTLGERLLEAHDQADALANARARDAMHLAMLNLASGVLPESFLRQNAPPLAESAHGASRIMTHLISAGKHAEVRAAIEQAVQRGIEAARSRGIVDAASLTGVCHDPSFQAAYRNNPAFALGVDVAIHLHAERQQATP